MEGCGCAAPCLCAAALGLDVATGFQLLDAEL